MCMEKKCNTCIYTQRYQGFQSVSSVGCLPHVLPEDNIRILHLPVPTTVCPSFTGFTRVAPNETKRRQLQMSTSFLSPSIRPSSYLPPLFSGQMKQVFCVSLCVLTCVCCFRCPSGSEGRGGLPEAQGVHEEGRHRRAPRIAR